MFEHILPAGYLFLGLMVMMLGLHTFRRVAELHGLTQFILLPPEAPTTGSTIEDEDDEDDEADILGPPIESQQQLAANAHPDYASISR